MSDLQEWGQLRETSREGFIYPGHAVPVALAIMRRYPSLEEAYAKGKQFPRALEDDLIPGAGGSVYYALTMLRWVADGTMSLEDALKAADRNWKTECSGQHNSEPDRFESGMEAVQQIMPAFRETLTAWQSPEPALAKGP